MVHAVHIVLAVHIVHTANEQHVVHTVHTILIRILHHTYPAHCTYWTRMHMRFHRSRKSGSGDPLIERMTELQPNSISRS